MEYNKFLTFLEEFLKTFTEKNVPLEDFDLPSFMEVYFQHIRKEIDYPSQQFEITLFTENDIDWEQLALELIKHGYAMNLSQNMNRLICRKVWQYPKRK